MIRFLVLVHVLCGSVALVGMFGALITKKGGVWHRYSGRAFVGGMLFSLLLALLVSILTSNVFLLLIGIFSGYFIFTGTRLAMARDGVRTDWDRSAAFLMIIVAGCMLLYGLYMLITKQTLGLAMIVFAFVAFMPAFSDYERGVVGPRGKERILLHLNRMGGACIASVTAVLVANVQTTPAFIAWLIPTFLGGPLIAYWSRRIASPRSV